MGDSVHQQERKAVPKFASFKATQISTPQAGNKASNDRPGPDAAGQKSIGRRDDKGHQTSEDACASSYARHKPSHHHSQWETDGAYNKPAWSTARKTERLTQTHDTTGDVFIDREGDPKIIDFGSLHRSAISNYRRSGTGHILGLPFLKIDRSSTYEKAIVLTGDGRPERHERRALRKVSMGSLKQLRIKQQPALSATEDCEADFLSLATRRGRERSEMEDELDPPSEDNAHQYRSIHGKVKAPEQPEDEDLVYSDENSALEGEGRTPVMDESTRQMRAKLNMLVEADPSNHKNWLQLIALQDKENGRYRAFETPKLTIAERQSTAEIKFSMYLKAIAAVSRVRERESLILAMMKEASQVWDVSKILIRWESLLRDHPWSGRLWAEYLTFRATTFVPFKYDDILAEFIRGIKTLAAPPKSKGDLGDRDSSTAIPYLVLRMTMMIREAGYTERAVAIWQALFEFHCFRPATHRSPQRDCSESTIPKALSAFEDFWESEVPRIGDDGAQGWAQFCSSTAEPRPPKVDSHISNHDSQDPYSALVSLEKRQTLQARLPGRTIDDVVEDDPYRIILFSDVHDILCVFPVIKQTKSILVESFLAFCHLPPLQDIDGGANPRLIYGDPFLRNDVLSSSRDATKPWKVQKADRMDEPPGPVNSPFLSPAADYRVAADTLFSATGSWFSVFDHWLLEYTQDQGPVPVDWIRRTLKALADAEIGGDALAEYFLALELRLWPETAAKTAKKLIRARQSSLRLYNAHICIETCLGHHDRAAQTLVAAINTSRGMAEPVQRDAIFLWHTWVWQLLSSSQEKGALQRLLSYSDRTLMDDHSQHSDITLNEMHANPTALLRSQQALTASRDHFISLSLATHASLACDLLTLLSYLSSGRSLDAAQSAFSTQITALSTRFPHTSSAHELLHQSFARLLHYHATNILLFKPAAIRDALTASIKLFPQNTIFLSLYAWNESRFRIDDRMRTIIKDVVLNTDSPSAHENGVRESVTPHFFAIYAELSRSVTFGSNTNTIRNTFERAVESSAGAHCAGIWKLYVLFEHGRGEKAKAKTVWWRGVRACPWVKALWMMAFEELREVMTDKELRGVWEMMGEKELRLHVNLEETITRALDG